MQSTRVDENGRAWLLFATMLALHVWDELLSDFLPFYNHLVLELRASFGVFPMPTFSLPLWIAGLTLLVVALLMMVPLVERGGRAVRWFAGFVSLVMILNALGHLGGSLYFDRWLPGATSSPLLLLSALWMLHRVVNGAWENRV
ncbi:MAG: HXXEE domain-containing protein [Gammaproteobacteria bacterium]